MIYENLSCAAKQTEQVDFFLFHRLDLKPQSAVTVLLSENKHSWLVTQNKFQTGFKAVYIDIM